LISCESEGKDVWKTIRKELLIPAWIIEKSRRECVIDKKGGLEYKFRIC